MPPGDQLHRMRRTVALLERHGLVRAMVGAARQLVHVLVQRAAERDVQLLKAAADGEQRHREIERAPDQWQGRGIAGGVQRAVRPRRRPAVVAWLDVRGAAGDHEAVELGENGVGIEPRAQRRDQEWQAAGAVDDAVDVLGGHLMVTEPLALHEAGRDPDQRRTIGAHHGRCSSRGAGRGQASATCELGPGTV